MLGLFVGEKMTNSRLVSGILADRCCSRRSWLALICRTSHKLRLTGVDGSTGVWKAVRRLEIPLQTASLARRFRVFVARSNFDVKISTVKIFEIAGKFGGH